MSAPRILLVDDEQSMLLTLSAILELEGMVVTTADSGRAALALLQEQSFDLVLSDVRMPVMNGVTLFREIRKLNPSLPVILMTAFAMESLIQEALRDGAFAVLPKPFEVERILPVLLVACRRPTALIIDADRPSAEQAATALSQAGIRARAVFDEQAAVQTIKDEAVDVCVIELSMAGSGEPPLITRLKAMDPRLSFIALSGHDIPELMRNLSSATGVTWLRKPAEWKTLARSIATARGQKVVRK